MKKILWSLAFASLLLTSCNKDKEIIDSLSEYTLSKEADGYHFGDAIELPSEVTENAEKISISFGNQSTDNLTIDPKYFTLGDNNVTFLITNKDGKVLAQDAVINVYAKNPEANLTYTIVNKYPHNTANFVQGFQLEGNTIYESDGQNGQSRMMKYTLGSTQPTVSVPQSDEIFSEGSTIVGDKVYQLTWRNKIGFIYNKSDLSLVKQFDYPNIVPEGWGLTYDNENLILSDGSKNLYFLNPENPSEVSKTIGVAGHTSTYNELNELEYHNGYVYANVWRQPIIVKIDPKSGEVVGKFDFSDIVKNHTSGDDDVLNGIAFKGENMLVTGKNWNTIYEVTIQ